jgi:23S rRNA (guanosine2251-2'-O)-methyltransferase
MSKIAKNIGYLKAVSNNLGFEVVESNAEEIEKFTIGSSHGGIIAIAGERDIPILSNESDIKPDGFYCMIQGIEDPYNFGYSLRSLYATGCDGIILPERNWMSSAGVVCRSSAGASELFSMFKADPNLCADIFHKKGYSIVCADERTDNVLGKCELKKPILLIVGGEKRGISKELLDKTDVLVKIEYARDFSASLSAASATTMFAYEIMRQN